MKVRMKVINTNAERQEKPKMERMLIGMTVEVQDLVEKELAFLNITNLAVHHFKRPYWK